MKHCVQVCDRKKDKMLIKGLFCICIQAALFKVANSQCIGQPFYPQEPLNPTNLPCAAEYNNVVPVAPVFGRVVGGNLVLDTSAPNTPIGPAGVDIFSDNLIIEGPVLVKGSLPFFGAAALDGIVPGVGSSSVSYGCGNTNVGMVEEVITSNGPALPVGGPRVARL